MNVKSIAELIAESGCKDLSYIGSYVGYLPLVQSMGYDILANEDEGRYQGDSFFLLRNPDTGEYGYLSFGWGSCSCCDALGACESAAELEQLRSELRASIQWKSAADMLKFFGEHDWQGDYNHSIEFVFDSMRILGEVVNPMPAAINSIKFVFDRLASAEAKNIGGI